jgi:hypothetical protein
MHHQSSVSGCGVKRCVFAVLWLVLALAAAAERDGAPHGTPQRQQFLDCGDGVREVTASALGAPVTPRWVADAGGAIQSGDSAGSIAAVQEVRARTAVPGLNARPSWEVKAPPMADLAGLGTLTLAPPQPLAVSRRAGPAALAAANVLRTGAGEPLISRSLPLAIPATTPLPKLSFEFGFATDELNTPQTFFDSFSISLQGPEPATTLLLLTADLLGVTWAPANQVA